MGRYLTYMQSQETAHIYDFWCGLWCISTACGRNAYVARPRAPVFLNLYIVLVGESGVPRKTTAVNTAARIVRGIVGGDNDVAHIDGKITPEALDALLHDRTMEHGSAQLCVTVPELAVFMGTERYIAHMPVLLTDLYDCPAIREPGGTLKRGAILQRNVWLSFLSASTPIWLLKTVNPNVVEGGFTSRCYFVISNTPKRSIPWPVEHDADLLRDLQDDMKIIHAEAKVRRGIHLQPQALEVFTEWYHGRDRALDPYKQSFQSREDAHVLRVAALLAVNDGTWVIRRSHIRFAIRLIHQIKEDSSRIFETSERVTKFATALDKIRGMLISTGMDPVPRHKLYMHVRSHLVHEEFITLIEVLHEIGAIQRFEFKSGDRGRPTDFIRGTNLLLSRGLGETVMERFS